jgi:hypothetical protein
MGHMPERIGARQDVRQDVRHEMKIRNGHRQATAEALARDWPSSSLDSSEVTGSFFHLFPSAQDDRAM